jgi:hypothetical protein
MELGPDLIALLTHLRDLDPVTFNRLLQDTSGAQARDPVSPLAPVTAVGLAGPCNVVSMLPPCSLVENFKALGADLLLPHYATFLTHVRMFLGSNLPRSSCWPNVPSCWWALYTTTLPSWCLRGDLPGI